MIAQIALGKRKVVQGEGLLGSQGGYAILRHLEKIGVSLCLVVSNQEFMACGLEFIGQVPML